MDKTILEKYVTEARLEHYKPIERDSILMTHLVLLLVDRLEAIESKLSQLCVVATPPAPQKGRPKTNKEE